VLQFTRLRLSGFKSFVEPTDLQIDAGLTGIVGPNGCGKSNLIEALRWAMGESSARQLRGGEMEDVIFAGSSSRPSRGFAEVTIDLDNTDASAPPPYSTCDVVQVSRRIQRDRGSLYRINGRESRARDVQLLFADASSGARSAAIVTQGQVATLIAAKATDRRNYLEEAAGISGLHSRRHEAELKLRAAEANLQRLEDVLSTLSSQLQNLRRQARQATRYRQISQDIRTTEARLFLRRWREAKAALSEGRTRLRNAETMIAEANQAVAELDERRAGLAAALPEQRQAENEAAAALERLRAMRDALTAEAKRLEADRTACRRRLDETIGDLAREQAQLQDTQATLQRLTAERVRLTAAGMGDDTRRKEADAALDEVTSRLGDIEDEVAALTRSVAEADAHQAAGRRRLDEIDAEQRRLQGRLADAVRQAGEQPPPPPLVDEALEAAEALAEAEAALTPRRRRRRRRPRLPPRRRACTRRPKPHGAGCGRNSRPWRNWSKPAAAARRPPFSSTASPSHPAWRRRWPPHSATMRCCRWTARCPATGRRCPPLPKRHCFPPRPGRWRWMAERRRRSPGASRTWGSSTTTRPASGCTAAWARVSGW